MTRPCVLTIAGFDPSGGAGLIADCKTFEQHGVHGLAVCTAITCQTDQSVDQVRWLEGEEIDAQLTALTTRFEIAAVKIGLIQDLTALERVLDVLELRSPRAPIVWDPVLRASAGFEFHEPWPRERFLAMCSRVTVVTPNREEITLLMSPAEPEAGAEEVSHVCAVVLKGGHAAGPESIDLLIERGRRVEFRAPRLTGEGKRGTGCVFSSSLAACLARGLDLIAGTAEAHGYVQRFLRSEPGPFGSHATAFAFADSLTLRARSEAAASGTSPSERYFGSRFGVG